MELRNRPPRIGRAGQRPHRRTATGQAAVSMASLHGHHPSAYDTPPTPFGHCTRHCSPRSRHPSPYPSPRRSQPRSPRRSPRQSPRGPHTPPLRGETRRAHQQCMGPRPALSRDVPTRLAPQGPALIAGRRTPHTAHRTRSIRPAAPRASTLTYETWAALPDRDGGTSPRCEVPTAHDNRSDTALRTGTSATSDHP